MHTRPLRRRHLPPRPLRSRCGARTTLALAALLVIGAPAGLAGAEEPLPSQGPVALDRLLKLPSSMEYGVETRGGATRLEWRTRFREAREALVEARAALLKAQSALEEAAGETGGWQLAPPGLPANATDAPVNYQLRQEVRRQREEAERLVRRLQDLEVEANLAGVPEAWRQ